MTRGDRQAAEGHLDQHDARSTATRRRSIWLQPVTIAEDTIHVDFTGTSGMSSYAINCPLCYTEAYTTFGINCVVAPTIPNNAGTLDAVKVTAPPGTIVSATYPAAVYARSSIGHMLPDVVYGAWNRRSPAACRPRAPPTSGA